MSIGFQARNLICVQKTNASSWPTEGNTACASIVLDDLDLVYVVLPALADFHGRRRSQGSTCILVWPCHSIDLIVFGLGNSKMDVANCGKPFPFPLGQDVNDIGDGEPLYAHFEPVDWALPFTLHLYQGFRGRAFNFWVFF